MASGCMAPASSQEIVSGIGTVIEGMQVKYWQSVPSVGSRPQYFKLAQIFGLPLTQNSQLFQLASTLFVIEIKDR